MKVNKESLKNFIVDNMILGIPTVLFVFSNDQMIAGLNIEGKYVYFPVTYAGMTELRKRSSERRINEPVDHEYAIWFVEEFFNGPET